MGSCTEEQRKKVADIAKKLVFRRIKDHVDISELIDDDHEKKAVVAGLNAQIPVYMTAAGIGCDWDPLEESDLDDITTVGEFRTLCYKHLGC
jgi:hypothetical protein